MTKKTNIFIKKNANNKYDFLNKVLYGFIERTENPKEGDYYKFGYETFGIVLYAFCTWMIQNLRKENISRILFFSRDGHIMKRAFELFPDADEFDYDYIYVSRRSLRVPQLFMDGVNKKEIIVPTRYITVDDLLYSVGLDPNLYLEEIKRAGLERGQVLKGDSVDKGNVKELLDNLWPFVLENSKEEYIAAKCYIDQLNIHGKVAVVDIGWRGSMQLFLQKMIDNSGGDAKLHGYYITLSSDLIKSQEMRGFLGNVDNDSDGCDQLRGYIGLIELLFSFNDGSAEKYVIDNDTVKVIKHECEYKHSEKEFDEVKSIDEIQRGAIDFVRNFISENEGNQQIIDPDEAFAYLDTFATSPNLKGVEMFEKFTSQNNGTITRLVECKTPLYYVLHPNCLKKDLYVSRWRVGFLKKMFKIILPYKAMFNMLMYVAKR